MSVRIRKNVGVIGLGIIGRRVADNLRERGFHVFVWNRTPRAVPNFVGSPAEVAEICDFIQIFVSDDEALLQMVQRILRNLTPDHVVLAHCTVSPDTMRAAAEMVEKRGARFLDAPFTGSKMAAENAQLVYYVGGDEAALEKVRPILTATSKEIIHIGKVGDATVIKVATNMVTAASVQAAAEALALVVKSGLPVEKFAEAMRNNGSNSATLDMKLPMMMDGNFEPHFSVKHMLKDVVIATRLARSYGVELGATEASREGLDNEIRKGRGDDDYSSLARRYFPAGQSLKGGLLPSNGEEDQPQFAGLDDGAAAKAEPVAAETSLEPPKTESVPAETATEQTEPILHDVSTEQVAEKTLDPAAELAETKAEQEAEASIPSPETKIAVAQLEPVREAEKITDSDTQPTVAESPETEEQTGEAGGMWGGFWRRQAGG
ncbi:MAG TPA: NAD(P)-dependent oxidoreductase [Chthoniobacterales bacterium]|nr:NAD(P)-dependent oxidoreductase [Chthoniobacterales bacterium]